MKKHARYYFIANKIIYDSSLHTVSNPEKTISNRLLTSASACLICLLQEKGKIVSRKTLMHTGWEKHGFIVTTNTLNQNVLLIRKALSQITDQQVLKTVFRQGITIPDEFSVISFDTPESLEEYINNYYKTGQQEITSERLPADDDSVQSPPEINITAETQSPASEPIESEYSEVNEKSSDKKRSIKRYFLINIILIPLILIVVFFGAMLKMVDYYKNLSSGDYQPLVDYRKVATVNGLSVYLNSDKCPADYALPFLEQHAHDFDNIPARNIYFSCERNIKRSSVLLCDNDARDPTADCSSFYYL
ncbi:MULTISPECIES: winged helix-turn-helix domain-containing protein [unclassified Tatumella]|uniref:winged helix-turn-helix domain-containing protein n=1 Tax=unclassified Tatumella TaxID=2649542 RepID=UPI001BB098EB|nr:MULTISPECIES: winged helix-turn-helix domain-containing protein [unclassified Tatumella]MBS0877920.1 winged helix-turn-helix domain-containing protein [Tatumella sp. JGM82]MBS0891626.1 winged helix-turn-helix domain-containing protein [Tatumella sp. JGM94]MBS0902550.1 winged helix-turn-helix domain-containing protein [Tatumella sp. JGM100]